MNERSLSDDTAANPDAHAFDLGRVADLEAHPQIMCAVVVKQDGKNAVVDDRAHKVGYAAEQGVQVERSVQCVGKADEEADLAEIEPRPGAPPAVRFPPGVLPPPPPPAPPRRRRTSPPVPPPVENPVDFFKKSTPAAIHKFAVRSFSCVVNRQVSRITLKIAPPSWT